MEPWLEAGLANPDLIEAVYTKYLENPNSVDSSWHFAFNAPDHAVIKTPSTILTTFAEPQTADLRIYNMIQSYRTFGHLIAKINPIATHEMEMPYELKLETLGFSTDQLNQLFPTYGLLDKANATLQEIIDRLKAIYCNKIGFEYMGLQNPILEKWIQDQIEPISSKIDIDIAQKKMILQQLNRSELFESFIHTKFTGQKRFSLEGGETLIPMLEAIIETGNQEGLDEFIIGMAHRGRLNVLSNILNKSYAEIFSEFEEGYIPNSFEGSGDVKYHKGFVSEVTLPNGKKAKVQLSPNPSHLEAVDPVVEGQANARQIIREDVEQTKIMPILIHGDAALAGQGIVYETLQLYKVPGYSTGGTLHLVVNNQIGFTATPEETRSTWYCTDIAKAFSAPVFHVNAEDPEGCVFVTNLAIKIRQQFKCDVFVDLNCYRKYGHNEADEPAFTQPLEYLRIRKKAPIREIYRDQLIQEGHLEKNIAESLEKDFVDALHKALEQSKNAIAKQSSKSEKPKKIKPEQIKTTVEASLLKAIMEKICQFPNDFSIHPKVQNLLTDRLKMVKNEEKPIDWGTAETLAYGSLLWEGIPIRISGQDCRRGTFSHRHAVWRDQKTGEAYSPLAHLKAEQGRFDIWNSPLSENAILGFEYGYSLSYPKALVIWEAQFGDFNNGAQVVIDQFIASAEQKWDQKSSLVLFLPHGYEGQGPEHSSGRIERFLTLAAQDNMRIVYPTTPAQLFHLLRKQALSAIKKPLIVFTPKGLLRYPACTSTLQELTEGNFQEIIDVDGNAKAKRIIFCTGRIYYDLIEECKKKKEKDVPTIIRIEQLFPFPTEQIKAILKKHKNLKECLWVQEEPKNMGGWRYIQPYLDDLMPEKVELIYVGREESAASATGSHHLHKQQHQSIMRSI